ncbi:type II toxin-antitoxin system PemK/MazF family toxin [Nocardioides sp.]|uniref:type II toxin-antitoxin system PemK/MazF family toxin n=1 Tax=Nocardioides sp. TaxID=35761 RepID=UPI0039E446E9
MRGDVHALKALRDARGHEQRGRRYAVVVQNEMLPLSTWLVAPTSTSAQSASFRPEVEVAGKMTLILVDQVMAIDPGRLGDRVDHLGRADMDEVDRALRTVFGLR